MGERCERVGLVAGRVRRAEERLVPFPGLPPSVAGDICRGGDEEGRLTAGLSRCVWRELSLGAERLGVTNVLCGCCAGCSLSLYHTPHA